MKFRLNKRRKLDYSQKKYKENPFFRKKGNWQYLPKSSFRLGKYIFWSIIVLSIGLVWFFLFSDFFKINDITLIGKGNIQADTVKSSITDYFDKSYSFLPSDNYFILRKKSLHDELNRQYNFGKLAIEKRFPRSLFVEFEQREYKYIWNEGQDYYFIDKQGYLIEQTEPNATGTAGYWILKNEGNPRIKDNKVEILAETIEKVEIMKQLLADKYKELPEADSIIIGDDENSFKLKIKNGPEAIFNLQDDMDAQLLKLKIAINEKLKDEFMKKSYIDIRFGDMIYYQ